MARTRTNGAWSPAEVSGMAWRAPVRFRAKPFRTTISVMQPAPGGWSGISRRPESPSSRREVSWSDDKVSLKVAEPATLRLFYRTLRSQETPAADTDGNTKTLRDAEWYSSSVEWRTAASSSTTKIMGSDFAIQQK